MFACSIFVTSCNKPSSSTSDAAYDRTIGTGTLKVGYVTYPPSFITDPNTHQFSGISHDILVKAAENLSLKIEFAEEIPFGSVAEAVDSGRVDLIATGIWPTASRGKKADFITPIFYSPVKAYVRANDNRFDNNLSKINDANVKISVMDGEMSSIIASSDYKDAKQVSLPQASDVSQLLLEVSGGKGDVTFIEPAVALAFIAKNPGKIKEVKGVGAVRAFPTAYLVSKNSPKLKSMLDIAVQELIGNGDVDRVLDKYEEFPNSFIRVPRVK